jgi:hypothetical protein
VSNLELLSDLPLGVDWTVRWEPSDEYLVVSGEFPDGVLLSTRVATYGYECDAPPPNPTSGMKWLTDLWIAGTYWGYNAS